MDATSKRNSALYHSTASSGDLRWSPLAERRFETPRPRVWLAVFSGVTASWNSMMPVTWRSVTPSTSGERCCNHRCANHPINYICNMEWNGTISSRRFPASNQINRDDFSHPGWMKKWSTSSWVNCPNRWIWIHLYVLLEDSRQRVFTLTGEEEWRSSEGAWCPITVRGHRLTSISSILRSG